jgi:hypothetical protein
MSCLEYLVLLHTVKQSQRMNLCRLKISLQGFEWFLYNRTEAYDTLAEFLESDVFESPSSDSEVKSSSPEGVF